jgi:hypothetical protein
VNTLPPPAAAYTPPTSHQAIALIDELRLTLAELPAGAMPSWTAPVLAEMIARLAVLDPISDEDVTAGLIQTT